MKKFIIKSIQFIVNSNIWIAFATVCLYELTLLFNELQFVLNTTVFFLFFSSLFTYSLFQFSSTQSKYKNQYSTPTFLTKIILFLSLLILLIISFFVNLQSLFLLLIAGFLTFLYATPFLKIGNNNFNLRKYWFLKSVIVATVWTISTAIIPYFEYNLNSNNFKFITMERFLFILGITIPYDIKDLQSDKNENGMNTIPMKFGLKQTKLLSILVLLLGLFLAAYSIPTYTVSIFITYILSILVVFYIKKKNSKYYFTFLIDGLIILYFLIVWIHSKV